MLLCDFSQFAVIRSLNFSRRSTVCIERGTRGATEVIPQERHVGVLCCTRAQMFSAGSAIVQVTTITLHANES